MDRLSRAALWWIPLGFALLVAAVGGFAYRTLANTMHATIRQDLQAILDTEVAAIDLWGKVHTSLVSSVAQDAGVRSASEELVELARRASSQADAAETLRQADAGARLRQHLLPIVEENGYVSYALLSPDRTVLASRDAQLVGRRIDVSLGRFESILNGASNLSHPTRPVVQGDGSQAPRPVVVRVAAGVEGTSGEVIAVLGLTIPAESFTSVLHLARTRESGETYAFDSDGRMLSHSRFADELQGLGLLGPGQQSILNIEIRDPGGDLTLGFVSTLPLRARPLTRMAAAAISGEAGADIEGYPDYRGVPVVGAWTWIPDLAIGVATEMDVAEAYAGLTVVQRSFGALAALFAVAALGMFAYTFVLARLQNRYETARKLGRYKIVEKIGEGGMGKVYRAQHALLRRPTAVKLLDSSSASSEAAKRFEREVQAAASLTHPNTIAIFDYGRTPDGAFYYAMEYLEGINAAQLVEYDGPQPEARAVYLVRQAAASVAEAHTAGLVHRDLKPSNIFLCERGGLLDFVKVLDFGLVRAGDDDLHLTTAESLTGTPLYLSPEALESPETMDARSDVYQLGAVLYTMLTGRPVFEGETLVEILSKHMSSRAVPPSEVLGHPISADLEKLLLGCLAKDRDLRPSDAGALRDALDACPLPERWTQEDARRWWEDWALRHPEGVGLAAGSGSSSSLPSGWQVDLGGRFRGSRSATRS